MNLSTRILTCVTAFVVTAYSAEWAFGELAVYYEMWSTDTSTREGLGDDFGLGFLGLLVVIPAAIIAGLIASFVVWRKLPASAG